MNVIIGPASPGDMDLVIDLLRRTRLPTEGVGDIAATLLVARKDGRLVGCAALEIHGTTGLLRSVAVEASCRGRGVGHRLVAAVEDLARRHAVGALFLLTETATAFFAAFGYAPVDRGVVPAEVQASSEFAWVCPATARVMHKALRRVDDPDRVATGTVAGPGPRIFSRGDSV